MTDLVTGEAVVLELRLAKFASRTLSLLIDLAVQVVLLFVGTVVVAGVAGSLDDAAAVAVLTVFLVAVVIGYPVTFETLSRGRTLGKMALGLRVVREDGGPIRFRHALVRGLVGVIEIWGTSGAVALVVSLASSQGKRLGDFLAGTVVVRERVPTTSAAMVYMPPMLAAWAGTLDLSRLPDDLALAARQYLSRAGDLAPDVRESMGARLATSVAAFTSPPPPPGAPAWAYLSAVLAERRHREAVRLGVGSTAPHTPYGSAPPPPYGSAPPPPYGAPQPARVPPASAPRHQHPPAPPRPATPPASAPAQPAADDGENPFAAPR